ncbi:MAG: Multidrug resistance protein MdtH [Phycisphaerae bacterium]|nr:Multidrug resistance protein MdtH [Phycisphaerae bacterium]
MDQPKLGFGAQLKSFPRPFYVANVMEIFERMAWYGWFTVMPVYVTGTVATGGLGFSTELRGALQGIVPFFLYLFPVFTGALADRYGYKKMFTIAYLVMIAAYYLLGQFKTVPTFFLSFMFVAVGAALFKPVVVGTVARVTNESNSATGFGIFYMMVNVGGFLGPIVAGMVRGEGWEWVFIACSGWALVNLIIVLLFYQEPPAPPTTEGKRSFKKVLDNMVEVLGNARFFITVFAVLFALMFANLNVSVFRHFTWTHCAIFVPVWLVANLVWDAAMPAGSGNPKHPASKGRPFFLKRMHCSNWRFALFLLIMSGFWTAFNQIFYTMPEYIRDFVDTRPILDVAEAVFGESDANDPNVGIGGWLATVNDLERAEIRGRLEKLMGAAAGGALEDEQLQIASKELLATKVRLSPDELRGFVTAPGAELEVTTNRVIIAGRQVNPEYIGNINAGAIVFFQVLISFLMARYHRFTTMIVGMIIASVGIGLSMFAGSEGLIGKGGLVWFVAGGIFIFSFGEMMASPTSQEYVGRIAPEDKKALYMGYYFVAVALGNLFGGILSGELMGTFAYEMNKPHLMWLAFGGIMLATALIFLVYNRFALPKSAANTLTPG